MRMGEPCLNAVPYEIGNTLVTANLTSMIIDLISFTFRRNSDNPHCFFDHDFGGGIGGGAKYSQSSLI